MKNSLIACLVIMITGSFSSYAQSEKSIDSKISNVTVFLSRAQVTRVAKTRIETGRTNLVVGGLTSQMDPQSVQVAGKGNFIILGISHNQNYLSEFNVPKRLQSARDSLQLLKKQVALEQNQKEILNKEEQMLLNNQKIGGAQQNLTVGELKAMADFYRSRLYEIGVAKINSEEKLTKLNTQLAKLNRQVQELNDLYSRNTSELIVSVSADAATNAELEINYVVSNAGWSPVYDLRGINTKSPVQLSYKANVYQRTGEEWSSVKLKLSTGNPSQGGQKPELYPWFLSIQRPIAYDYKRTRPATGAVHRDVAVQAEPMAAEEFQMAKAEAVSDYTNTVQTTVNTEFEIGLPYTVLSSPKPTLVDIRNLEMKATYEYSTAPKLDGDAFLLAKATGWEDFNLLPGEANIFFEGTFVGKTFIDPNNVKDTLAISMGRDKRIVVKREKLKDFSTRRTIGSNQRDSFAWEISVRNTKAEAIEITVEDQVPVSQNNQIEVTVEDVAGASYNKTTGKLVWSMSLKPNETRKVVFKYEVKYPKGTNISGL